jgi:PAS domain S-box-containing protein
MPPMRRLIGKTWPAGLATYAAAGGAISVAGWAFDVQRLTDWFGTGVSIQPNTGVAALLAGIALFAFTRERRAVSTVLGLVVTAIGAAVLFEYATGIYLGIDHVLMFDRPWGGFAVTAPGRMGLSAALSWTLLGAALVLRGVPYERWPLSRSIAPALAAGTAVLATLSIIGYLYGANVLYTIPAATAVAFQTSTFVLAMSLGVMMTLPDHGPVRLLAERSAAGEMLRRTIPAVVVIPIVLGFLRLMGERAGYYDLAFGTAARTLVEIALLMVGLWWAAGGVSIQEAGRREAEDQLVGNEALLRLVTDEAHVGLVIIDRDHRFVFANRAYGEIIRHDPADLLGRHVKDVLPGAYTLRVKDALTRALAGETVRYEIELDEPNTFAQATYQPHYDQGVVKHIIAAIVETTDRRRAEEALRQSQRELQEEAQRKDRFLMTLAHELRNPLAPIRTAADLLQHSKRDLDFDWARTIVDKQAKYMSRLLDDLLDIGRISRDKLELKRDVVDLAITVTAAIELSQPGCDDMEQVLRLTPPREPIFIDADPIRVEQVVANLLNNACKYTPRKGAIDVVVSREGDFGVVSVRDSGRGIPAEDLERIFTMFGQFNRAPGGGQGGLGIGLHLARQIMDLHGGTIEARSQGTGQGSEFVVRFPALPATFTPAEPAAAPADAAPSLAASRTILIVDDNVDAASGLATLLSITGHTTHTAHDGENAIETAARVRPDVILLDIGLPDMTGYEVCRELRERLTGDGRPTIIALTGWGQESDRQRSREAGFDHHLVKPVQFDALNELLK